MATLQDVVVTIVAAGSASVIVRRILEFVVPGRGESACSSCSPSCAVKPEAEKPEPAAHVLHLVRKR